jgi:hypothetical protein
MLATTNGMISGIQCFGTVSIAPLQPTKIQTATYYNFYHEIESNPETANKKITPNILKAAIEVPRGRGIKTDTFGDHQLRTATDCGFNKLQDKVDALYSDHLETKKKLTDIDQMLVWLKRKIYEFQIGDM